MVRGAVVGVSLAAWMGIVQAHPRMAAEVNYPLVAGFERFYSEQDPPAYLAEGGLVLLNELNCVGCHEVSGSWNEVLSGIRGPDLAGIGSRVRGSAVLQLQIRNPRFLRRATTMPSLFAASDRDPEELEALFHYLATLKDPVPQPMLLGDSDTGRAIYHRAGCVACHAPDQDYVVPGWIEETARDLPGMPSQPIRWAGYWTADFVTRFLMDPVRYRPSGRMPGQGLSEREAAHVTAYLQDGADAGEDDLRGFEPDAARVERGRELFSRKNCAVCHEIGRRRFEAPGSRLAMAELENLEGGCLAEEPVPGGIPFYFLSAFQRHALREALSRFAFSREAETGPGAWDRRELDRVRMDCYACHSHHGKGGPELAREPYFGALDPRAPDREAWLPPPFEELHRETRTRVRPTQFCDRDGSRSNPAD